MATPSRPIDAYKALIDQLVNETSHSVTARIVVERGIFPETSANAVFNDLVRTLAPERRKLLGQMLNDERMGAIHDALAVLTWWISSQGLGLTFLGESMPVELSGAGLHGDYIGRRDGWEWPNDGDLAGAKQALVFDACMQHFLGRRMEPPGTAGYMLWPTIVSTRLGNSGTRSRISFLIQQAMPSLRTPTNRIATPGKDEATMFGFQACVWRPSGNAPAIELQKHPLRITVTVHQTIVSNGPDDEPPPACAFHFVVTSDSHRRSSSAVYPRGT